MENFFNKTFFKLESAIQELDIEVNSNLERVEAIMQLIIESLADLKDFVVKNNFKNVEEEIHFFKHQKPIVVSKLIYYNAIYKIETRKPYGTKRTKKYLYKELKKLKRFFDNNLDFYKYFVAIKPFLIRIFLYVVNTI